MIKAVLRIAGLRIAGLVVGSLGVVLGYWNQDWGLVIVAVFCLLAVFFNLKAETYMREHYISDAEMAAFYEENRKRRAGEIK